MNKMISVLMTVAMLLAMLAGCGNGGAEAANGPASSLEVLENIWALFADEERFSVYGGNPKENMEEMPMDMPGNYDLADENITGNLLIPADQVANVDDVASMTHGFMVNNFNAAVYHLADGVDAQEFCETMYNAVSGNQWICGMPDRVIIAAINSEYVLVVYGVNAALDPFETHLAAAYPDAVIAYNESLV